MRPALILLFATLMVLASAGASASKSSAATTTELSTVLPSGLTVTASYTGQLDKAAAQARLAEMAVAAFRLFCAPSECHLAPNYRVVLDLNDDWCTGEVLHIGSAPDGYLSANPYFMTFECGPDASPASLYIRNGNID